MLKDLIAKWTSEDQTEIINICDDLYKKNKLDAIKADDNVLLSLLKKNKTNLKQFDFTPDKIYFAMTRQFISPT